VRTGAAEVIIPAMTRPSAPSKLLLVADRRERPGHARPDGLRRYRLARLADGKTAPSAHVRKLTSASS
jgi:hypothetical protein